MTISKSPRFEDGTEFINSFPAQKARADDIEIEYKILGNKGGWPIIFVPGLTVTMDMWELKELVSSNYGLIVFNNGGAGNSSIGVKDYSIVQLANNVMLQVC